MNTDSGTLEGSYWQLLKCMRDPVNQQDTSVESAWQQLLVTRKLEQALASHIDELYEEYIQLGEFHWTVRMVLQACIDQTTALVEDTKVQRHYLIRLLNFSQNEIQLQANRQRQLLIKNLLALLNVERTILTEMLDLLTSTKCKQNIYIT